MVVTLVETIVLETAETRMLPDLLREFNLFFMEIHIDEFLSNILSRCVHMCVIYVFGRGDMLIFSLLGQWSSILSPSALVSIYLFSSFMDLLIPSTLLVHPT